MACSRARGLRPWPVATLALYGLDTQVAIPHDVKRMRAVAAQDRVVQNNTCRRTTDRFWKADDKHIGTLAIIYERRRAAWNHEPMLADSSDTPREIAAKGVAGPRFLGRAHVAIRLKPTLEFIARTPRLDRCEPSRRISDGNEFSPLSNQGIGALSSGCLEYSENNQKEPQPTPGPAPYAEP